MIYLIVLGRFLQYFSEFIDFGFTAVYEKDFCFHEKELAVKVWTDYYKYEICLDDIFNCFGKIFAIFVSEFIDLFLLLYTKRTVVFTKRS